ncbi:MAG TPA: ABC transporter substrate-binding protein [Chloroflexota bacterium]|nr:ABC transporter substrate-binding protein [Chloroflexota bacterium]
MRYRRRWLPALSLLALTLAACGPGRATLQPATSDSPAAAPADAASQPTTAADAPATPVASLPQKVTVSYSSISGSFLPLFVAMENGLFAKQGLDVDVTYIASGTTSMQSLIAGDVQFIVTSGAEPTAAYLGGAPVRIILGWLRTLPALFMVNPSITSPEQLRGQTIGITRFGGQPHVAARLALKAWGLDPDTDVQYLQLGGVAEIMAATQSGAVAGGAYSPPTNVKARKLGLRTLGDLGQMGIPYQGSVLAGLQPYLDANPEVVRRFERAMLEGIQVSLTDDAATQAALAKFTRTDDPELLDETISYYRSVVQRKPYPSAAGLQTVLDDLAESDPRARTIQPLDIVDTTVLEQLDREGYLKQLFGE